MGFISFEGAIFLFGGGLSPPKPMTGYIPASVDLWLWANTLCRRKCRYFLLILVWRADFIIPIFYYADGCRPTHWMLLEFLDANNKLQIFVVASRNSLSSLVVLQGAR